MVNAPCKECTSRHTTCHDTCLEYKGYKQTQEEIKTARTEFLNERSVAVESVLRQSKHKI